MVQGVERAGFDAVRVAGRVRLVHVRGHDGVRRIARASGAMGGTRQRAPKREQHGKDDQQQDAQTLHRPRG